MEAIKEQGGNLATTQNDPQVGTVEEIGTNMHVYKVVSLLTSIAPSPCKKRLF